MCRPLCSRVTPDVRDRQTDRRQTDVIRRTKVSLNAPRIRGGDTTNTTTSGISYNRYSSALLGGLPTFRPFVDRYTRRIR